MEKQVNYVDASRILIIVWSTRHCVITNYSSIFLTSTFTMIMDIYINQIQLNFRGSNNKIKL